MNYELALMALDGLAHAPIRVAIDERGIELSGDPASFRELARLLLLLGGEDAGEGERIELAPGIHLERDSPRLVVTVNERPAE